MGAILKSSRVIPSTTHQQQQEQRYQQLQRKRTLIPRILLLSFMLIVFSISHHFKYARTLVQSFQSADQAEILSAQQPALSRTTTIPTLTLTSLVHRNLEGTRDTNNGNSIPSSCTSPEKNVPWPFHGETRSRINADFKCGIIPLNKATLGDDGSSHSSSFPSDSSPSASSSFADYFRDVLIPKHVRPILEEEQCQNLVVFGVAFGEKFLNLLVEREEATRARIDQSKKPRALVKKKKNKTRRRALMYNPDDLIRQHHRCFFMFVLEEESDRLTIQPSSNQSSSSTTSSTTSMKNLGHNWLIPIPSSVLPYQNMRRNAKMLKYMGQLAFTDYGGNNGSNLRPGNSSSTSVKTIVWQDAKFLRFDERVIPTRYDKLFMSNKNERKNTVRGTPNSTTGNTTVPASPPPCVITMGLPTQESAFFNLPNRTSYGRTFDYRPRYEEHCHTIIDALNRRPSVTDSAESLMEQCRIYLQQISGDGDDVESGLLDQALIDSAFIVWNESTEMCRQFNAALRCTIMDQIHCHSDRDQVTIPFALNQMGLEAQYYNENDANTQEGGSVGTQPRPVDDEWQTRIHDLDWVYKQSSETAPVDESGVLLRIVPSSCHWYYTFPIGRRDDCNKLSWLPSYKQWTEELTSNSVKGGLMKLSSANKVLAKKIVTTLQSATASRHDYRQCTTPEKHVPWPLTIKGGVGGAQPSLIVSNSSIASQSTCGVEQWPFFSYLQASVWTTEIRSVATELCHDYVIFDASFDVDRLSEDRFNPGNHTLQLRETSDLYEIRGKCRFLFFFQEDLPPSIRVKAGIQIFWGDNMLLPISRSIMPYANSLRNANLLKYMLGHSLLGNISTVIWHSDDEDKSNDHILSSILQQRDVDRRSSDNACVTAVGVPVYSKRETIYQDECKKMILLELSKKPSPPSVSKTSKNINGNTRVKDELTVSLTQQCDAYVQLVYGREMGTEFLDQGLVDTSLLIWNESTGTCRDFNAALRCSMLNQLHCHSDRDQVAFPFALYQLGLSSFFFPNHESDQIPTVTSGTFGSKTRVKDFHDYATNFIDFQKDEGEQAVVRVIRSNATSLLASPQPAVR